MYKVIEYTQVRLKKATLRINYNEFYQNICTVNWNKIFYSTASKKLHHKNVSHFPVQSRLLL